LEKVSIIIPVYNSEDRLKICINSLLAQTYKNIELIIINDGSTDKSGEIIKSFYERHPCIINVIEQQNKGVASARNRGLSVASGEFLMFVDSDDYLDSRAIEKVVFGAKKHNADITRFGIVYKYSDGSEKIETSGFPGYLFVEKEDFKKHVYNKIISGIEMNSVCRTLYKKQVVGNATFREDMATVEDLIFNIGVFTKADNFLYLPYPYYYYCQTNKGLTGSSLNVFTKYKYNIKVSIVIMQHLKLWGMANPFYTAKTMFRLMFITFSKLKRRFLKSV